jgi:hypothetical protein
MKQILIAILTLMPLLTHAADITVGDGQSLAMALRQAREMRRLGQVGANEPVTIRLSAGQHRLYESLFLRPEDSGTPQSPTIIRGEKGAVLSGGVRITGWKRQGKLWVTRVPDFCGRPFDFRQLWVNGRKAVRARDVDDFEKMNRILSVDKKGRRVWVPSKAVKAIVHAPYAEMVLHEMWCVSMLRIKSIAIQGDSAAVTFHEPESQLDFDHPWPSPMTDGKHNSPFYLCNAKELLDRPGEWYHDLRTGLLYYYPRQGEQPGTADVEAPALENLVEAVGTPDRKVHDIRFENVTFNYTTWNRPSLRGHVPLQAGMYLIDAYKLRPKMIRDLGNHKLDNQGWLGRARAAVELNYADRIDFSGCTFEHLGGSGLDYVVGCEGGSTTRSTFTDIAMNGYVCGSFSPQGLETHLPYDPFDRREVCTGQTISDCSLTFVGNEDWGCVAICAGYVANINIEHNDISEVPYTGISLGWGWTRSPNCMRNNRVTGNRITHYAMHVYDTAGIYTLGMQPNTFITENVVSDIYHPSYVHDPEHWFYLYNDEGSGGITVKDNWTEAEKYLRNANGPGNIWENNGPAVADSIKARAGIRK